MLDADPDLGSALPPASRERARKTILVDALRLERGVWEPAYGQPPAEHLGFLLLGGSIARELVVAHGRALELLGRGDLLRPWEGEAASFDECRWQVLEPAELAELGPASTAAICRYPGLIDALLGRAMRRCRSLAASTAIHSITGLERRLVALFWHLAESGGTRGPDGVAVPRRLTHREIAELVGARRPSVTAALRRLAEDGSLVRNGRGWLLRGDPPGTAADRAA